MKYTEKNQSGECMAVHLAPKKTPALEKVLTEYNGNLTQVIDLSQMVIQLDHVQDPELREKLKKIDRHEDNSITYDDFKDELTVPEYASLYHRLAVDLRASIQGNYDLTNPKPLGQMSILAKAALSCYADSLKDNFYLSKEWNDRSKPPSKTEVFHDYAGTLEMVSSPVELKPNIHSFTSKFGRVYTSDELYVFTQSLFIFDVDEFEPWFWVGRETNYRVFEIKVDCFIGKYSGEVLGVFNQDTVLLNDLTFQVDNDGSLENLIRKKLQTEEFRNEVHLFA